VDEVGNPTILATFAVIGAILPMAFVRGLMGPYMRPIPVGASAAMVFSLIVAFVVSPWAALRLLRTYAGENGHSSHEAEGWTTRLYRRAMNPLILDARRRWMFLGGVVVLLLGAAAFIPLKWVRVKMLPFDKKSEFQVIIDMPDGTPLEQNHTCGPGTRSVSRGAAGGHELPDLCRHLRTLQFQRPRAALFSA
jgi:multidrug efflux pump subunit AcrB